MRARGLIGIALLIIALGAPGCATMTAAKNLTRTHPGMTKNEVTAVLGQPESVSLSFIAPDQKRVEVWDFRLSQYSMATTLSPYFDIYGMLFVNDTLRTWQKTEAGSRLSERAAMKLLGYPDATVDLK